jgi:hypothetical protein
MSTYEIDVLATQISELSLPARNNTEKGRRLQDLIEWMFRDAEGIETIGRNVFDLARSEEKDLWLRHDPRISGLPFADAAVPIECKNETTPISASEVRDFEGKIRNSGGLEGLMVGSAGLSGQAGTHAHQAITVALSRGVRIVVLGVQELRLLESPDQLVGLVLDRHTELRLQQSYVSI